MKIIHQKGYSEEDLFNYRAVVFKNVVECAKALIIAMRSFDIELSLDENKKYAEYILTYVTDTGRNATIDPEVGVAVRSIWSDSGKDQLMERRTEFYLMDSAE